MQGTEPVDVEGCAASMSIETFLLCAKAFLSSFPETLPVRMHPLLEEEFCSETYTAHPRLVLSEWRPHAASSAPASPSGLLSVCAGRGGWVPFLCDGHVVAHIVDEPSLLLISECSFYTAENV